MFKNSVRLFDISGFQVRVDPSWLLIAMLVVWSLSTSYFPEKIPGLPRYDYIWLSVLSMLGLFASLILHELSHSLVARRFGLSVGGITLFLFGGVAELEHEPVSAKSEFWIAIAGPSMSLALAALAYLALFFFADATSTAPFTAFIGYLGLINLVLAIFNLVPAFPLDGGRVLRALIWQSTGDLLKATRIASRSGTFFALFLIAIGVLSLFSDLGVGGLWQILIGFFILAASKSSYQQMLIKQSLGGLTAAKLMTKNPVTADASSSVQNVVDSIMLARNVSFVPITEGERLLGHVDTGILQKIDRDDWATTQLSKILVPLDPENSISEYLPLETVFEKMARGGRRKFLVENDGRLRGVITLSDMLRYLSIKQDFGLDMNASTRPNQAVNR